MFSDLHTLLNWCKSKDLFVWKVQSIYDNSLTGAGSLSGIPSPNLWVQLLHSGTTTAIQKPKRGKWWCSSSSRQNVQESRHENKWLSDWKRTFTWRESRESKAGLLACKSLQPLRLTSSWGTQRSEWCSFCCADLINSHQCTCAPNYQIFVQSRTVTFAQLLSYIYNWLWSLYFLKPVILILLVQNSTLV